MALKPPAPAPAPEKTNTKLTFAQNGAALPGGHTGRIVKKDVREEESSSVLAGGATGVLAFIWSKVGKLGLVAFLLVGAGIKHDATMEVFERARAAFYTTSIGKKIAEKSATLDAQLTKAGTSVAKPLLMAKQAANQAGAVPPELLALAPEIKAEDVAGKPAALPGPAAALAAQVAALAATGAPAAGEPAAAVPTAAPGAASTASGSPSAASGAASTGSVAAAVPEGPAMDLESTVLSKCAVDQEFCHSTGLTFLKDNNVASALRFFAKACDHGLAKSCSQAAGLYRSGQGVERSDAMARTYYEKGCLKNSGPACVELGMAYLDGAPTTDLLAKARVAIERGCELGHGPACLLLGIGSFASAADASKPKTTPAQGLARGCDLLKIQGCGSPAPRVPASN